MRTWGGRIWSIELHAGINGLGEGGHTLLLLLLCTKSRLKKPCVAAGKCTTI